LISDVISFSFLLASSASDSNSSLAVFSADLIETLSSASSSSNASSYSDFNSTCLRVKSPSISSIVSLIYNEDDFNSFIIFLAVSLPNTIISARLGGLSEKVKTEAQKYPNTQWTFQYSPESFSSTEVDFSVDVCNAVIAVWQPSPEHKIILNLPATIECAGPNVFC